MCVVVRFIVGAFSIFTIPLIYTGHIQYKNNEWLEPSSGRNIQIPNCLLNLNRFSKLNGNELMCSTVSVHIHTLAYVQLYIILLKGTSAQMYV